MQLPEMLLRGISEVRLRPPCGPAQVEQPDAPRGRFRFLPRGARQPRVLREILRERIRGVGPADQLPMPAGSRPLRRPPSCQGLDRPERGAVEPRAVARQMELVGDFTQQRVTEKVGRLGPAGFRLDRLP